MTKTASNSTVVAVATALKVLVGALGALTPACAADLDVNAAMPLASNAKDEAAVVIGSVD